MGSAFEFEKAVDHIVGRAVPLNAKDLKVAELKRALEQLEKLDAKLQNERDNNNLSKGDMAGVPRDQRFRVRDRHKAKGRQIEKKQDSLDKAYLRLTNAVKDYLIAAGAPKVPKNALEAAVKLTGKAIKWQEDFNKLEKIIEYTAKQTVHTRSQVSLIQEKAMKHTRSGQNADPVLAILIMLRALIIVVSCVGHAVKRKGK